MGKVHGAAGGRDGKLPMHPAASVTSPIQASLFAHDTFNHLDRERIVPSVFDRARTTTLRGEHGDCSTLRA